MKTIEKQVIRESEAFVAVLMPAFVKDPSRYESCKYAEKLKKPIYFIIEEGVDWDKFKDIDYRKVFHTPLVTPALLEMIKQDVHRDLDFIKKVGGI